MTCNGEAPGVEQFARRVASKLTVVGLGAYDSLDLAKAFATRYKMTRTRMLWDPSAATWRYYGVPGQPAALLIRGGKVVKAWTGPLDEKAVERALG